jgi:chemotaxis methyl-accepting protein methylase
MTEELDALIQRMCGACSQDLTRYDPAFLAQSLERRLAATGGGSAAAYLARLAEDRGEAVAFYRSLSISHSEFFRTPLTFALLEALVLPAIAAARTRTGRPEIRVWSAGCAGGQEPYSLAILLAELAAPHRIFASDIAAAELDAARQGVYGPAAMQNVRLRHLRACFEPRGEGYAIRPHLRDAVDFSRHDLLDPRATCPAASIFGDFDLIFCCNVLIYYRPDVRRLILDKLRCCLAPGGYLVTGEAERAIVEQMGGFTPVAPPVAVFRRGAGADLPRNKFPNDEAS